MEGTARRIRQQGWTKVTTREPQVVMVIPTVESRAWCLPDTIESLLQQSFTDLEVLVGIDRKSPSIDRIVARFREHDPRVRLVFSPRRGNYRTVDWLVDGSRSAYVGGFSDDDVWEPRYLEACVEALRRPSRPAYVYTDYHRWSPQTGRRERVCGFNFNAVLFDRLALDRLRERYGHPFEPSLRMWSDSLALLRLGSMGSAHDHVHEPLLNYRIHENQITRDTTFAITLDWITTSRLVMEERPTSFWPWDEFHPVTFRDLFRNFAWIAGRRTGLSIQRLAGRAPPWWP